MGRRNIQKRSQIIGDEVLPFDDREEVAKELSAGPTAGQGGSLMDVDQLENEIQALEEALRSG